jgi:hypothetical protein
LHGQGQRGLALGASARLSRYADETAKGDGQVGYAHGFDDGEDDDTAYMLACAVLFMRLVGA